MNRITKENVDNINLYFWKWTVAIGPGMMFNDRDFGFYILKRTSNYENNTICSQYHWAEPISHSWGAYMTKTHFDTEKEAIEYFLEIGPIQIYQIESPWDLKELADMWHDMKSY